jgi:drug/metabolite transporter (DMT)-like permease
LWTVGGDGDTVVLSSLYFRFGSIFPISRSSSQFCTATGTPSSIPFKDRIKNTKVAGVLLIVCGVVILAAATYFGIPSFVLFCIAGMVALKEIQTFSTMIQNKK